MGVYKFSLEKVLEWRLNTEKETAKKFAIKQSELTYQEEVLNKLIDQYENIKKEVLKKINIRDLKQEHLLKQKIEDKIEEQIELIKNIEKQAEELRLELLEAQKNRKIMEKLKEKDYNKYMDHLMSEEQKHLDEMAVLRFGTVGQM